MNTKATPGPWKISEPIELSFGLWRADVFLDDFLIAEVYGNGRDETSQRGKMVATAPELRDALEVLEAPPQRTATKAVMVAWFVRYSQILNRARAALAKVEEA